MNYQEGSPPSLFLFGEDGEEEESVRMDSWKLEDILEYLDTTFAK